jgi:hypothetical protein
MKKRYVLNGSLILLVLLGGTSVWNMSRPTARANPTPAAHNEELNPLVRINQKARAAKSGGEPAIRELVDEIFLSFDFAQQFAEIDESIKDRLVRAELNRYASHGKSSCSERRVVQAVNRLADRIGTPAYTHTNLFEVRRLRAGLLAYTPDLQDRRPNDNVGKNQKQDVSMSPLETFFVTVTLIQQKQHNPEYQLTNDEWIALHGNKRSLEGSNKFSEEMQQRRISSTRTEEVRKAVEKGITSMRPLDLLQLPDELLGTLGIER